MGVHLNARSGGLLQQLVQILQIVPRNHDERPLLDVHMDPRGHRVAEGAGVGLIQKSHALVVYLAKLQNKIQPFLDAVGLVQGGQPLIKPGADLLVPITEIHGVVRVGCHALQPEQKGGAQRHHIRFPLPKPVNGSLFQGTILLKQGLFHPAGEGADGFIVKVDVGERGKQAVHQKAGDRFRELPLPKARLGQLDQPADQRILQGGGFGLLAANAGAHTAAAARGLLTLKAEHF